jgi:small GTP-binding protein
MIQKKACMLGVFGTGKTALVQRYVHSIFSPRYLSTVGVKIDRKTISVGGEELTLLLWDLEGRDDSRDVNPSYVRGAHGLIFVVDGTRRETFDQVFEIRDIAVGDGVALPSVLALNKADLADSWVLTPADEADAATRGFHVLRTSAKTGEGVEPAFQWLAEAMHTTRSA